MFKENKRPFTAWLAEISLESLPNWEEKQMFKVFMEDHNTATFPSKKLELQRELERQKEERVLALKRSTETGMAQAMKEQAQLREEMAYQYKLGNFEAAAAIQRRLDPDAAM